jgi:eukaryotic-like serine/threonine-protein kinase
MTVMTPERWQRMKGVLYEALELPPGQRAEFLDRACSGEDSFRREVDSLLSSNDSACSSLFQSSEHGVPLSSGTKLGHYEVQSLLGAGGMGEVYRGHDPRLGRDVAIKVLPPGFSNDRERLRRFEQEARAAAALNHPNIVAIHDVGTTNDGIPYVVSELLDGETLRQCLTRGPIPVRKTVDLALQMASGLAAAHDKGIVHRDLKPENLFLTKNGHLKILDFGLAKLVRSPSSPEARTLTDPEARTLTDGTSAGAVMGTLGYMPPEQVRGLAVDQRSDIFAAGAIVYEMLSGKRAFCGETRADTIEAILSRDPPALSETNPSVPPSFERIVRRCLEKDANERFHSVRDVAFALAAISEPSVTQGKASTVPAKVFRWKPALLAGVLILVASLLWIWNPGDIRHGFRSASTTSQIRSLAVLPLENVSGNPEQEYFADGMTDELITELAGLNELRVISRTSVMPFKATRKPLSEIAAALNVDAVVEGSVLRDGDRVRITAQLVQAATDRHLWAKSYEGSVADVIRLQNDVARSVSDEIRTKLRPAEKARLNGPQRAITPEAYDAYLKGLYFSAKLTPDSLQKAFEYFNHAIQSDPTFAPAYAGLAEAYGWAAGLYLLPPQEALQKSEAAATKALEIDLSLGMAHHALAWVKYARGWDLHGAEREFQRAIELNPNNATAHLWYGMYLAQRKRIDQSFAEMQLAKQLDPFSSVVNSLSMTPLLASREYDRIVEQAAPELKTDPNDALLNWFLTSAYERKGDFARAIDGREKQAIAFGEDPQVAKQEFAAVRREFSVQGERGYWLSRQKSLASTSWADPFDLAVVDARLGETDATFDNLEKAYQQRSVLLLYWLQTEPAFDRFLVDSRFQGFVRRIGLPQ